eukprot:11630396-Karenia_brevis.AAC.1
MDPNYKSTFREFLKDNNYTFPDSEMAEEWDEPVDVDVKSEGGEPSSSSQVGADVSSSSKGTAKMVKREDILEEMENPDSILSK